MFIKQYALFPIMRWLRRDWSEVSEEYHNLREVTELMEQLEKSNIRTLSQTTHCPTREVKRGLITLLLRSSSFLFCWLFLFLI